MSERSETERPADWVVVIPVKPAAHGKSRLQVPGVGREQLARAIALDTIEAAAAVARVIVVTDDPQTAAAARRLGAEICTDPGDGLDAAVAAGTALAGTDAHRAALLGDVPALRPEHLTAALRDAAAAPRAAVADADGTGTTLVTAAAGTPWASAFGSGSFARHLALGCVPLAIPDTSTLRRDVDTAEDLTAASTLGLGRRTAALLC
ncbi:MAG TPA: 2-phospho-L-lactate guanylyltransferase [Microbacterium sp.]|uniref:2-phospho-L-lactate guanylyltransferase n=1 Tax=Microbacterium sp. TaxID=51671 RepID=UPI002B466EFF|nr:2-phospho-L-lactate guanylyltransferase [Microbacterium sp.]HKT57624.1 2-phospho-L-lactate guanylyltransferase [Microbacterium sp.]